MSQGLWCVTIQGTIAEFRNLIHALEEHFPDPLEDNGIIIFYAPQAYENITVNK